MFAFKLIREIVKASGILVFVTYITFFYIHLMPSSDAQEKWFVSSDYENSVQQPIHGKYLSWLSKALRFDFEDAKHLFGPVNEKIRYHLHITVGLLLGAIFVSVALSLLLGILLVLYESSRFVRVLRTFSNFLSTVPIYLFGIYTMIFFYRFMPRFYVNVEAGYTGMWEIEEIIKQKLPITLLMFSIPSVLLGIGNGMLIGLSGEIKDSIRKIQNTEFIRAVRARGASVTKHIARNLTIELVSMIDARITYLISGAVIIENVFNWKGLGFYGVQIGAGVENILSDTDSMYLYNYPVIMAMVFIFTLIVLSLRIGKNILFYCIDARVRRFQQYI